MKFTTTYFIYVLLAGVCTSSTLFAQQAESPFADIDYIRKSNSWLNAKNAAGLTHYNTVNISTASIFFSKEDGGFRNYFQSDNSQDYGLRAESYTRLSKKVVLSGGFEYENFKGKNMSGSVFIDPYQSSFDIVELDAANKGTKESELYSLNGALGAQVSPRLSIGGRLDYGTANFAKRKDLRHVNKLLTMDLSAGALYQLSNAIEIGANYNYNRRIESLSFKIFGNTDRQYLSLISYGSFYGRTELFGDYGYTSNQNPTPLKDIRQGGSLQLNVDFNKAITLFNEFSYEDRNGFFGVERTTSALLTKHHGLGFGYSGQLSIKSNAMEHHIGLKGNYDYLENKETIYRRETTLGGVNRIAYYGDRQVFSGETSNAGLTYDLYLDVKNNRPTWSANFSLDYMANDNSTGLFPFYRDQKIHSYQVSGQLNRQYQQQKHAFNIALGLGYGGGGGDMAIDGTVVAPAADHVAPTTMAQFINEEYEFFTATRVKGNVQLQYTRTLQNNLAGYVKLNYAHIYAGDVSYLSKHFNSTNISVGCNF